MKALVYEAPKVLNLREVPVPRVADNEVLVRVSYAGICGSELSGFLGMNSLRTPPLIFGHELAGRVVEAGSASDVSVGARVTANPLVSCGRCEFCSTGRQQQCREWQLLGASLPGCNAEYVAVPAASVHQVPDGMSLATASMTEPAACALHAVRRSGASPGESALVIGAGPIGLFILQVLERFGVSERYAVDLNRERLARAAAFGAVPITDVDVVGAVRDATGGRGVDRAFDAVGSEATRQSCVLSAVNGATVIAIGLHADVTRLPVNALVRSELSLVGVFAYPNATFGMALHWLEDGWIGLDEGVVVAPLEDGAGWYQRLISGDPAAKVLLEPAALP